MSTRKLRKKETSRDKKVKREIQKEKKKRIMSNIMYIETRKPRKEEILQHRFLQNSVVFFDFLSIRLFQTFLLKNNLSSPSYVLLLSLILIFNFSTLSRSVWSIIDVFSVDVGYFWHFFSPILNIIEYIKIDLASFNDYEVRTFYWIIKRVSMKEH